MPHKHTHRHARSERFEEFAISSFNQASQALLKETPAVVCWSTEHAGPLGTDPQTPAPEVRSAGPAPRTRRERRRPILPARRRPMPAPRSQRPRVHSGRARALLRPAAPPPRSTAPAAPPRPAHPETQTGPGCEQTPARPQARDPPPRPATRPSPPQGRAQRVTGPRGGTGRERGQGGSAGGRHCCPLPACTALDPLRQTPRFCVMWLLPLITSQGRDL